MLRRDFTGAATRTVLTAGVNNSVTSLPVADASSYPSGNNPFVVVVDRGTPDEEKILVSYYNEKWELKEERFEGYSARIIQHEYDHIEGILFTDLISSLKKQLIKKKLQNIMDGKTRPDYRMKFCSKKGR